MSLKPALDLGNQIKAVDANASASGGAPILVVAGGAGDGVEVTGETIDRFSNGNLARSAALVSQFLASLGASETLSLAHSLQESDDGVSWDTAEVIEALTVKATGGGGGTDERGTDKHNISLEGRKRFIRFNVTPDFSAGATDTGYVTTMCVLGGFTENPVT